MKFEAEQSTSTAVAPSEHGSDCGCVRCTGFQAGNGVATTHGCYSRLALAPRAEALRAEVAELVPFRHEADAPLLDVLSITLAQVERAGIVLAVEQADSAAAVKLGNRPSQRLDRLAADTRAWVKTAARLLDALGLSPTSRARLGLDVARGRRALSIVEYYQARAEAGLPVRDDDEDEE